MHMDIHTRGQAYTRNRIVHKCNHSTIFLGKEVRWPHANMMLCTLRFLVQHKLLYGCSFMAIHGAIFW
jgi:hypothetical protein